MPFPTWVNQIFHSNNPLWILQAGKTWDQQDYLDPLPIGWDC